MTQQAYIDLLAWPLLNKESRCICAVCNVWARSNTFTSSVVLHRNWAGPMKSGCMKMYHECGPLASGSSSPYFAMQFQLTWRAAQSIFRPLVYTVSSRPYIQQRQMLAFHDSIQARCLHEGWVSFRRGHQRSTMNPHVLAGINLMTIHISLEQTNSIIISRWIWFRALNRLVCTWPGQRKVNRYTSWKSLRIWSTVAGINVTGQRLYCEIYLNMQL